MTIDELRLATQMRFYQKKYFETRNSLYLSKAKETEKQFDALLDRYNAQHQGNNNSQQAVEWSK